MPYLASGTPVNSSLWTKTTSPITRFLWGIVNVFVLFFRTLTEPFIGDPSSHSSDYRVSRSGGGPFGPGGGGPRRRMGGFRGGHDNISPPPMSSGG